MADEILERLAVIEAIVRRLESRLFGNGQPGEISAIKKRVARLESWLWRATGAAAILLCILDLLVHRFPQLK